MIDFVITPTYNERNNIRTLVERLFSLYPQIHVLVVDDNSPDKTADVVRELQLRYPNLHLKERPGKLGLASAYLESFEDILKEHNDVRALITMDADLSHDPEVIKKMLEKIETYDMVIGSRYVEGGGISDWQIWRLMLSKGGNFYARHISSIPINDLTAGYQCLSAKLLRSGIIKKIKATGFAFQMEIKMFAHAQGAKMLEVPILFKNRIDGESKISKNIIYEGLIVPWLLRKRVKELFRAEREHSIE